MTRSRRPLRGYLTAMALLCTFGSSVFWWATYTGRLHLKPWQLVGVAVVTAVLCDVLAHRISRPRPVRRRAHARTNRPNKEVL